MIYPFDPVGDLASNLIIDEAHNISSVNGVNHNYIVPRNAPFHNKSMVVVDVDNGNILEPGTDYDFGYEFQEALDETGENLSGCIYFIDTNFTGNVKIAYRTLGGDFVTAVTQTISNGLALLADLQTTNWDDIAPETLPTEWPATPHTQPLTDVETVTEIIEAIDRVANILVTAPPYITVADIRDFDSTYVQPMIDATNNIATAISGLQNHGLYHERHMLDRTPGKTLSNPTKDTWINTGLTGTVSKDGTYLVSVACDPVITGDQAYSTRVTLSADGGVTFTEVEESALSSSIWGLTTAWIFRLEIKFHGDVTEAVLSDNTNDSRVGTAVNFVRLGA